MNAFRSSVFACLSMHSPLFLCWTGSTVAQTYPTKPIRLIVPFAAGGGADSVGRLVAEKLGPRLGGMWQALQSRNEEIAGLKAGRVPKITPFDRG